MKILILEDNVNDAELVERALKGAGISFIAKRVETREAFEVALHDFHPDLIISDYSLPAYNGRDALEFVQKNSPEIPVIMFTGALGEEAAVELLNAGAKDYVLKDRIVRLPFAIERVLAETESAKARRESERLLRESEAQFRNILEYAPTGIGVASLDGHFVEVNTSFCKLLGYTHEEFLHLTFMDITHPDDRGATHDNVQQLLTGKIDAYQAEKQYIRKNGGYVWVQVTVSLLRDSYGNFLHLIGQVEDISERKRSQEEIKRFAYYDALTCLPNRRLLMDRLSQSVAQARRHRRSLAVMFLDLDRFKEINDILGHDVGDKLLKVVAERLEACVRNGDTVSRQGGDEFVIILPEIAWQLDAAVVAQKILDEMNNPITIQGRSLRVTTSIGIAVYSAGNGDDAISLLRKADIAMYEAKGAGGGTFRFYTCVDEGAAQVSQAAQ